ncbi:hypothetical protein [Gordonia insulae]|uniref:Uncharacterized protein n=1 Tax=Gordonia insulae TaxID=2420509 RepID=A0A3G8JLC8_9ACTN|nr:hypothetical protein [Gordonia insulae]AZG45010.1 hypothetical protein D7316_01602 [Gordonia insulae]
MNPMTVAAGLEVLAAQEPEGPEFGKASPLGLLIIIVLLVATALLIRSMNSQLKKLPKTFDSEHPEPDQAFDDGTDSVSPDSGPPRDGAAPATSGTARTPDEVQADERKSAET